MRSTVHQKSKSRKTRSKTFIDSLDHCTVCTLIKQNATGYNVEGPVLPFSKVKIIESDEARTRRLGEREGEY